MAAGQITHQVGTTFTVSGIANAVRSFARVAASFASSAQSMAAAARRYFAPILAGLRAIGAFSFTILRRGAGLAFRGISTAASLAFKGVAAGAAFAALKIKSIAAASFASSKAIAEDMDKIGKDAQRLGMTVEEIQALRGVFERQGVEADEVLPALADIGNEFKNIKDQIKAADEAYAATKAWNFRQVQAGLMGTGDALSANFEGASSSFSGIGDQKAIIEQRLRATRQGEDVLRRELVNSYKKLQADEEALKKSLGQQGEALFTLRDQGGLDIDKAIGGGMDGLYALSDAFKAVQDPATKLRVSMQLFGEDAGAKMVTVLDAGRKGIEDYRKEMDRFGGTMTKTDAKLFADFKENSQRMTMAIRGVRLELARGILPLIMESQAQLTEWLITNRSWIAETMKTAFVQVRAFLLDIIDIWHGKRGDFRTGWLNSVGVYLLYAIDLAGQLRDQLTLIFSGADSDWEWLNVVRDGFVAVKDFAVDAFRVLTGGQAETYKWLNTAKQKFDEFVVVLQNFWSKLQEAWQIFYGILEKVHEAFATVLGLFSDVDPTVGLMVLAFAKLSGVLTLAVTGFGLLARAGGLAFGSIATAAGGAAGSISATALALRGLMALGPWGAAVGAVGVAGTLAYQARQRSLDGVLDAQTEVERLKGDRSYDARQTMLHNRMMRLQTPEGQDYRILDQRQKGINNPYRLTSSEEAAMTGESYAKRFGAMAPNPYAIREAKAAEARDRENAAIRAQQPSQTYRIELAAPNGQTAEAIVNKAFGDLLRENGSVKR